MLHSSAKTHLNFHSSSGRAWMTKDHNKLPPKLWTSWNDKRRSTWRARGMKCRSTSLLHPTKGKSDRLFERHPTTSAGATLHEASASALGRDLCMLWRWRSRQCGHLLWIQIGKRAVIPNLDDLLPFGAPRVLFAKCLRFDGTPSKKHQP